MDSASPRRRRRDPDGDEVRLGFRKHGKPKDHRDDLPQVVIGLAVTREGIPVRVWCWPGNTSDQTTVCACQSVH